MAYRPITRDFLNMRAPSERRRPPFFRRHPNEVAKVAFIGMTQSHAEAPWADPSWILAVHPCCHTIIQREPEWWFDLHPPSQFRQPKGWHRNYLKWLQTLRTPIFMQKEWEDIPMAIRFPKERILSEYRPYFTNHVAWMIALAMTEGVKEIGIYGCEYSSDAERGLQRGSLEYWLGRFEQAGGKVHLPVRTTLLSKPKELYGYQSHDETTGKLIPAYRAASPKKVTSDGLPVPKLLTAITDKDCPPRMVLPCGLETLEDWKELQHA